MNQTMMNVRTVALVKELTTEMRHGANGDFESKSILFRIATDRNYRTSRVENGKTIMEYPTDFFLAKATGKVAEAMAQYCTAKKEDGKLVSRHLLLTGSFETYQKNVTEHVVLDNVNINGMLYKVEGDVVLPNRTQTIFVIDSFSFLDKNPNANQQGAPAAPVAAPVSQPMGQSVQAGQPIQYTQPQTAAPVSQVPQYAAQAPAAAPAGQPQYAPAAPVSQPIPVQAAPVGAPAAPVAPQAPTVGQDFSASSGTAPF